MIVGILHVLYSDLKGTATAVYVDKSLYADPTGGGRGGRIR